MGLCKLHSEGETLGLSLQLHALSCSVYTPALGVAGRLSETGRVDLGLVELDMALREPEDCVPDRQLAFLKRADQATRRLWFLWNEDSNGDCGCCGGCQFLDGCISRQPLTAHCTADKSLPQTSGLQALKRSLQTVSVRDVACPQLLHSGLLEYYERPAEASPAQPSTGSDTESFVSAQASLNSSPASDTNQYFSLENVNEAGLEGHTLPELVAQKNTQEGCNQEESLADNVLLSLLPLYKYHSTILHINPESKVGGPLLATAVITLCVICRSPELVSTIASTLTLNL